MKKLLIYTGAFLLLCGSCQKPISADSIVISMRRPTNGSLIKKTVDMNERYRRLSDKKPKLIEKLRKQGADKITVGNECVQNERFRLIFCICIQLTKI